MTKKDASLDKGAPTEIAVSQRDRGFAPGRIGTFAVLGAVAGGVPLPWLPDVLARRVRGALSQDVVSRHGLSLTREARAVLAEPAGVEGPRGLMAQGLRYLTRKALVRFGPLGMLPPVRACLQTFVLGHLLSRYLETSRTERSTRVDVEEARTVRSAIDRALVHALTAELATDREMFDSPPEDLRDEVTQIVDGLLIATAGVPSWLVRRLDASFDDVIAKPAHG